MELETAAKAASLGAEDSSALVLLDFSNAFGSVEWTFLQMVLERAKIPSELVSFIWSSLVGNRMFSSSREHCVHQDRGVRQGAR